MNRIMMHIAGPSGSGKTELCNALKRVVSNIHLIDLDSFDEQTEYLVGGWQDKNSYNDAQLLAHHQTKQRLVDKFVSEHEEPIIFFGHIEEAGNVIKFAAYIKVVLTNIISGAIRRGKHSNLSNSEITDLIRQGREDVSFFYGLGYVATTAREVYSTILAISKELLRQDGV